MTFWATVAAVMVGILALSTLVLSLTFMAVMWHERDHDLFG